jgi:hypothetical protein
MRHRQARVGTGVVVQNKASLPEAGAPQLESSATTSDVYNTHRPTYPKWVASRIYLAATYFRGCFSWPFAILLGNFYLPLNAIAASVAHLAGPRAVGPQEALQDHTRVWQSKVRRKGQTYWNVNLT